MEGLPLHDVSNRDKCVTFKHMLLLHLSCYRTLEERCPQGFKMIEFTPTGFLSDLNHGSITAHCLMLCYKRGKGKPPLIDVG